MLKKIIELKLPMSLSRVIHQPHMNKTILDIEINNTTKWRKKHWMSIYLNYKNTKYFSTFSDFFEDMYNREWYNLNRLLKHQMNYNLDLCQPRREKQYALHGCIFQFPFVE